MKPQAVFLHHLVPCACCREVNHFSSCFSVKFTTNLVYPKSCWGSDKFCPEDGGNLKQGIVLVTLFRRLNVNLTLIHGVFGCGREIMEVVAKNVGICYVV